MTNVARHAEATQVDVNLKEEDGYFYLIVQDNGRGISDQNLVKSKSFGLLGLRERSW